MPRGTTICEHLKEMDAALARELPKDELAHMKECAACQHRYEEVLDGKTE